MASERASSAGSPGADNTASSAKSNSSGPGSAKASDVAGFNSQVSGPPSTKGPQTADSNGVANATKASDSIAVHAGVDASAERRAETEAKLTAAPPVTGFVGPAPTVSPTLPSPVGSPAVPTQAPSKLGMLARGTARFAWPAALVAGTVEALGFMRERARTQAKADPKGYLGSYGIDARTPPERQIVDRTMEQLTNGAAPNVTVERAQIELRAERNRVEQAQFVHEMVKDKVTTKGATQRDPTCHPNGEWIFSPDNASPRAKAYEAQITGMPADIDYVANGVKFDGCDPVTRDLLEAKGPGYEGLADRVGRYVGGDFFRARALPQMVRQNAASGTSNVQWHVAEVSVAASLDRLADRALLNRISVQHTPAH